MGFLGKGIVKTNIKKKGPVIDEAFLFEDDL